MDFVPEWFVLLVLTGAVAGQHVETESAIGSP
jgi:hypothetical protein